MSAEPTHRSKESTDTIGSVFPREQKEDFKRVLIVKFRDACRLATFMFFIFAIVFGGTLLISVGIIDFYKCPLVRCIPIYLIAEGVLLLVTLPNVLISNDALVVDSAKYKMILGYRIFLCTWELALLVFGTILVYGAVPPNFIPARGPYCHKPCYLMAFFMVTMTWVSLSLGLLFCATVGFCFLYCPVSRRQLRQVV